MCVCVCCLVFYFLLFFSSCVGLIPFEGFFGVVVGSQHCHGLASCRGEATRVAIAGWEQGMRGLSSAESTMGVGILRHLYVLGMFREAPGAWRAHQLRPICFHGLMVGDAAEENAGRRERGVKWFFCGVRDPEGHGHCGKV